MKLGAARMMRRQGRGIESAEEEKRVFQRLLDGGVYIVSTDECGVVWVLTG